MQASIHSIGTASTPAIKLTTHCSGYYTKPLNFATGNLICFHSLRLFLALILLANAVLFEPRTTN